MIAYRIYVVNKALKKSRLRTEGRSVLVRPTAHLHDSPSHVDPHPIGDTDDLHRKLHIVYVSSTFNLSVAVL